MNPSEDILTQILSLPESFHGAGSYSKRTLDTLIKYCRTLDIQASLETGSGKSTLLFSHFSQHHKVFALDRGNGSITNVLNSSLFNKETVEFIDGPTQKTLPTYKFEQQFQIALIDGPHGYPFPDLEYYYIYPLLSENAILIVDDIQIPTIYNMYQFIKADPMFELLEIVDTTAFFKRTNAPTFDPTGDGWRLQPYNQPNVEVQQSKKQFLKRFIKLGLKMAKLK